MSMDIKKLLQNWLGITKMKADIHNLDGDVMCCLEKQQDSVDLIPIKEDESE